MSTDTPEPVLIYARISEDTRGEGEGVAGQLADGRRLAELRGWQVAGEFSDNDISATHGAERPGYQALMSAAGAGRAQRIIVFHTSRLWRNRLERAQGIAALATARVSVAVVKGADLDLTSAQGRAAAGIAGEFDTWESEVKSERVTAAAARRAREGRTNGAVLYGWTRTYTTNERGKVTGWTDQEQPEQAAIVREITDRLLTGGTLAGIRDDLNRRGVPAPGASLIFTTKTRAVENPDGTAWGRTSVKKMALRPANAGLRIFHRGKADEELIPAAWPALLPRERWEKVVAMLTDSARIVERPATRQHLLTWGIGACGMCGGNLRVATKRQRFVLYVCDAKGCVGRNESAVDDYVRAVVIERLSRPDALGWMRGDDDLSRLASERAEDLRVRLDTAADQYAEGLIDARQLARITDRLRPQIEEAQAEALRSMSLVAPDVLLAMAGPEAEETWDTATLKAKRDVLKALRMSVRIMPVTRHGPGFDPASVLIEWA